MTELIGQVRDTLLLMSSTAENIQMVIIWISFVIIIFYINTIIIYGPTYSRYWRTPTTVVLRNPPHPIFALPPTITPNPSPSYPIFSLPHRHPTPHQVLWPYLFEVLVNPDYSSSAYTVCRCLCSISARRRDNQTDGDQSADVNPLG